MSLRSTIQQIRTRDHDLNAISQDLVAFVEEWRVDLVDLYEDIKSQLSDLVDDGLVSFGQLTFNVQEEQLGKYEAPGLLILAANRTIVVAPQARLTSGGAGRVDMYRKDNPSTSDRIYVVRRVLEDGVLAWMVEQKILDRSAIGSLRLDAFARTERLYAPLGKDSLESAIDYALNA